VDADDLVYPCNDPRIQEQYLDGCWANQPSLMYQFLKGDLVQVGQECLKVENKKFQKTCFHGLARQIQPIAEGKAEPTFRLCALMPPDWVDYCVVTIAESGFGIGDREGAFKICGRIADPQTKKECFRTLSRVIAAYATSLQEKQEWCTKIPDASLHADCVAFPYNDSEGT